MLLPILCLPARLRCHHFLRATGLASSREENSRKMRARIKRTRVYTAVTVNRAQRCKPTAGHKLLGTRIRNHREKLRAASCEVLHDPGRSNGRIRTRVSDLPRGEAICGFTSGAWTRTVGGKLKFHRPPRLETGWDFRTGDPYFSRSSQLNRDSRWLRPLRKNTRGFDD